VLQAATATDPATVAVADPGCVEQDSAVKEMFRAALQVRRRCAAPRVEPLGATSQESAALTRPPSQRQSALHERSEQGKGKGKGKGAES
jgi:hypothetical protein